jgi:predicted peroxiredoxin
MSRPNRLVIKLATGISEPEHVAQAFSVATTALASGVEVSFWLAGDAAWLALPGKAEEFRLEHSAPLHELLASLVAHATVTLCTQCAVRRNIKDGDQISGIRIAGSATFVEEIMQEQTQALVY